MPYKDKEQAALAKKIHYECNKEKIKDRTAAFNKQANQRNKEFINKYLETHSCVDCGESDPIVLEFDHVRGNKLGNIADMSRNGYSIEKIEEEIFKCDVRCANCHRRVTHQRRLNG